MRIGIDARFYGPHAGTGIGRYTNRLIEHLEELDPVNEYVIFLRDDNYDFYHPRSPRFMKVRAPWRWYSIGEQLGFPRLIRRFKLDVTHYLNFNVPLAAPRPFVVTIHDLILSKFPTERASTLEPAFYWLKHAAYNLVIRAAVRRSSAVVAVTKHTKQDVVSDFHAPAEKIKVIYESSDAAQPLPLVPTEKVLEQFHIQAPYLLYVGTAYPHKNLERLIEAVAMLSSSQPVTLVLAGRDDYFYQRLRRDLADRGRLDQLSRVVFTGYVPDGVLDALYRGATLYVCPALYEGFGLSGLEAMARGTPVVSSNSSCLPEVYGQAAAWFDPTSSRSMADAIGALVRDPAARQRLVKLGLERVRDFSWRRMAEQTLGVYTSLASRAEHAERKTASPA